MNDNDRRRTKRARLVPMSPPPPLPSLVDINTLDAIIINVEQFLCIEDTINFSKTCHAIRNILVHNPNGAFPKIKVSHFEVVDDDTTATEAAALPSYRRINNFVSNALAHIHFPTLERLVINFSKTKGKVHRGGDWANEIRDSFIYLAVGLERAINLEELVVDFTPFLNQRSDFLSQNNYDTLSENLCCCTKLKRLKVINRAEFNIRGGGIYCMYSPAFLAAFIPAIERGVSTIEGVSLDLGEDIPFNFLGSSGRRIGSGRSVDNDTAVSQSSDLFRKTLLCNELRELSVIFTFRAGKGVHHSPSSPFNSFLQVSRAIHSEMEGLLPSSSIEKLTLKCEEVANVRREDGEQIRVVTPLKPDGSSIAPFMDMISKQPNLDMPNVFMDGH
eukprot:scaffold1801_cov79-Skeletonema_menzelii.AAC.8